MNAAETREPVEVVCTVCGFGGGGEWTSTAPDRCPIKCPPGRGGCGAKVRVKRTPAQRAAPAQTAGTASWPRATTTPKARTRPAATHLRTARATPAQPPAPALRAPALRPARLPRTIPRAAEGSVPNSRQPCCNCRLEKRRDNSGRWPAAIWHIEVSGAQQFAVDLCAKCHRSARKIAPPGIKTYVTEIATGIRRPELEIDTRLAFRYGRV